MPSNVNRTADEALERLDQVQADIGRIGEAAEAGSVAGLVAHEVRNLLTPAVAYSQLALRNEDAPASMRHALERSLIAMRRACEVSELILFHLRAAGGTAKPTRIAEVVSDCIATLGWDTATPSFELAVDVPDDSVACIPTEALRHVLLNLLLNARTSLPASGGRIAITKRQGGNGATWNQGVALCISDNGKGIEPAKLAQINAGLASARGRGRLTRGHSGLGLILCDRLLAASGGELRITSREHQGTIAVVALPTAA